MPRIELCKKRWVGFGCKLCYENILKLWSIIISIEFWKWELYINYTYHKKSK